MDRKTAIIGFRKYFNSNNIFQDFSVSALTGKYELDIIGLDRWCHEVHGYTEEIHGSLKDFINSRFGEAASKFITDCLEGKK